MITINGRHVRVVDAHVHIFPDELSTQRETWLERDAWFRQLYENPKARLATAEDLIASMNEAGVDHSIVCGFPWSDITHCTFHNDYMSEAVATWPDRLSWLGTSVPGDVGAELAADCFARGARGIGEMNADAQGFRWTETDMLRSLAECVQAHKRAFMIHASEPVGHTYPGKGVATPGEIAHFAGAFPELQIVAAHWGGGLPIYELMLSAKPALANVSYDSAATTYLYEPRIFEHVIAMAGSRKVVYATDYPVLGQVRLTRSMADLAWPDDESIENVMHRNAERIYGLDPNS